MNALTGFTVTLIAVLVGCIVGWLMNVVALCRLDFREPFKAEAIRIVGVFVPPVGAVAGYVTFDEER